MKQNYIFHTSVISSAVTRTNHETFDLSIEAFNNREYLKSMHLLIDSLDQDIRQQCSAPQGNEFHLPHGPVTLHLLQNGDILRITAPFTTLSKEYVVPMMRQIAVINFDDLDLSCLNVKNNALYFEYECPVETAHPQKIRHVVEEICSTAAYYEDKFCRQFGSSCLSLPVRTGYAPEDTDYIHRVIQESCRESLQTLQSFETSRQFEEMQDIITTTFLKILYVAQPQGKLLDFLEKNIDDMNRQLPPGILVADGKQALKDLQKKDKEEISKSLYYTAVLIPGKKTSNLQYIREKSESVYKQATAYIEEGNYLKAGLKIMHRFYEIYDCYRVQEDLDRLLTEAFRQTSGLPWEKATLVLYETLEKIMSGPLTTKKKESRIAA